MRRKTWTVLGLLCIAIGYVFSVSLIVSNQRVKEREYTFEKVRTLSVQTGAALRCYEMLAEHVCESDLIRNDPFLELLERVGKRGPNRRELCLALERTLHTLFRELQKEGFDDLRFFDALGEPLLALGSGVPMEETTLRERELLQKLHASRKPVSDFQRTGTGVHYVFAFPLFRGADFLGSVHFGLSLPAISRTMQAMFGTKSFFVLWRGVLEGVHQSEGGRFRAVAFFPDLLISESFGKEYADLVAEVGFQGDRQGRVRELVSAVARREADTLYWTAADQGFSLTLYPLEDKANNSLGYLMSYEGEYQFSVMRQYYRLLLVFISLFFLLLFFAAVLLAASSGRLEKMATRDRLTGAYNRHFFAEVAANELKKAARNKTPLSLIMFDVDHFKTINDTYGHHLGDMILKKIVATVREHIRSYDAFARWGGDEFVLLLPDTPAAKARELAERLRNAVAEQNYFSAEGVSVSIGVSQIENYGDSIETVVEKADRNMYTAKQRGRNRVE